MTTDVQLEFIGIRLIHIVFVYFPCKLDWGSLNSIASRQRNSWAANLPMNWKPGDIVTRDL